MALGEGVCCLSPPNMVPGAYPPVWHAGSASLLLTAISYTYIPSVFMGWIWLLSPEVR